MPDTLQAVGAPSLEQPRNQQQQPADFLLASAIKNPWWTTGEDLLRFQKSVGQIFHRKNQHADDRMLYRVVDWCPEFTGVSGDDIQDISHPETGEYVYVKKGQRQTGFMYRTRYVIEAFQEHATEMETLPDKTIRKKRIANPKDSFRPYADDFLSKHELRVEGE